MRALCCSLVLLAACEPIAPTGSVSGLLEARPEATQAVQAVAPAPSVPGATEPVAEPAGFDFDADAPSDEPVEAPLNDEAILAGLGLEPVPEPAPTAVEPAEAPLPAEPAPTVAAVQTWTPDQAVTIGFGVRLVSTLAGSQPPRAILGLPDGSEVVVEPGTMVPSAHVVVLAIGRDAIQVAEVTPMGDRAKIESRILEPLYRQGQQPQ